MPASKNLAEAWPGSGRVERSREPASCVTLSAAGIVLASRSSDFLPAERPSALPDFVAGPRFCSAPVIAMGAGNSGVIVGESPRYQE
jgi:hypothetical protein